MSNEIRIYVADLAAYNNGRLHGVWIDATLGIDEIQEHIRNMLKNSPEEYAEEYAIHDHEGFDFYSLGEYEDIGNVNQIACFINQHPTLGGKLINHFCGDLDEARKAIEENYSGCYGSLAHYAQELTEGSIQIPESLEYYIDYERMGRDMNLSGNLLIIEISFDEIHVFWNS